MIHLRGTTACARSISQTWLISNFNFAKEILIGLPEYDDRFDVWRVPLHAKNNGQDLIGEIKLNREANKIKEWTDLKLIETRLKKSNYTEHKSSERTKNIIYPAPVPNKIILGNSIEVLKDFPTDTAQLIFTSPPYFNAKPEYSEYTTYGEYLNFIERVFSSCHSILSEGRFIVINISPVLIRRTSRSTSSKRYPLQFDYHAILNKIGFDFIDDIIWEKPEGAGWNLGRGRRFKADRNPLQYKPVPITEYILVYRKRTTRLIDWNIRKHWNKKLIEDSKIMGNYDVTNIWKLPPAHSKIHPAVFPVELAEKVIRYYSFIDDLVLDPFAGIGTVAIAARNLKRRFLMIDNEMEYFRYMKQQINPIMNGERVDFDIHENYNPLDKDYEL
jgi:DNA modification methylase